MLVKTPHPVIVTIRDNRDHSRILVYPYPTHYYRVGGPHLFYWDLRNGSPKAWSAPGFPDTALRGSAGFGVWKIKTAKQCGQLHGNW